MREVRDLEEQVRPREYEGKPRQASGQHLGLHPERLWEQNQPMAGPSALSRSSCVCDLALASGLL